MYFSHLISGLIARWTCPSCVLYKHLVWNWIEILNKDSFFKLCSSGNCSLCYSKYFLINSFACWVKNCTEGYLLPYQVYINKPNQTGKILVVSFMVLCLSWLEICKKAKKSKKTMMKRKTKKMKVSLIFWSQKSAAMITGVNIFCLMVFVCVLVKLFVVQSCLIQCWLFKCSCYWG